MARREMKLDRYIEIQRMIENGVTDRKIAKALKCSRNTVGKIRRGEFQNPNQPKVITGPLWSEQVDWVEAFQEAVNGHPVKFFWEENAQQLVGYKNFMEQFHKRNPQFKQKNVVPRVFNAGEYCEVDYTGATIQYRRGRKGVSEARIFVGILCCSQLIFATGRKTAKSIDFLDSHREMFEYFGGVPKVICPDNLKTGVLKPHLYDPDINKSYLELNRYYGSVVVPTRVCRPKDKALVENAVKLVMRYFRWKYRRHEFNSLSEVNTALRKVYLEINDKTHTRFKTSRKNRFKELEQSALQPLPQQPYEVAEWKQAKLHPDSHVLVESAYYSAPHKYRGQTLNVKITNSQVEIYKDMERLAVHTKSCGRPGCYVTHQDHMPENAKAYYEMVPQSLLSQSRFISSEFHSLVVDQFNEHALGNLRKVQGLLRESRVLINKFGKENALWAITDAITDMRRFNRVRVHFFKDLANKHCQELNNKPIREITRKPGNPNLRYN